MGDSTHMLTAHGIAEQDTAQIHVPADVQRELGIAIDDEVEVTIDGLQGLFEAITITGHQVAGDRVTVPAEVARRAGVEAGREYEVSFDLPDDEENLPGAIPDSEVADDEDVAEAIEEVEEEDDLIEELFGYDDEDTSETDPDDHKVEEDDVIGELFG